MILSLDSKISSWVYRENIFHFHLKDFLKPMVENNVYYFLVNNYLHYYYVNNNFYFSFIFIKIMNFFIPLNINLLIFSNTIIDFFLSAFISFKCHLAESTIIYYLTLIYHYFYENAFLMVCERQ